ncbi:hypothetical protein BGZ96_006592 [Linnemannia gamsii]|uniref:Uncharacterized protein n=1 Tax=Linnemannia gamsii TaxID=64522 RepID=A0ABQ7KE47_9FUNG|nr:hypothetical protein BGZ96_006592 [Linnemannia gamsii]
MSYFKRPAEYYRRTQWTYPDTLRVTGSVIPTVIPDVIIVTTFTAVLMWVQTSHILGKDRDGKDRDLYFPNMIVPALSVVVGLILAFRTNTAYDRFWEGRKQWASLDVQMRNFSRMIWVGMKETNHSVHAAGSAVSLTAAPAAPGAPAGAPAAAGAAPSNGLHLFGRNSGKSTSPTPSAKAPVPNTLTEFHHADDYEKVLVIKLLLAFAVSTKHHLRQEFGVRYFDLEYLLPEGFAPCASTDHVEIKVIHDKALGDRHRHYNEDPWTIRSGNDEGQMSLPLEIAYALSLWVLGEARGGRIESSLIGSLLGSINSMTDIFTNMERIEIGWGTVPLMALVSFTLFGMEGIGREIENPFGKDANDLHMDDFCRDLKRELQYLVNLQNTVPGAHA